MVYWVRNRYASRRDRYATPQMSGLNMSTSHALGISEATRTDLTRRLARIRGQVEGLTRMVEDVQWTADLFEVPARIQVGA